MSREKSAKHKAHLTNAADVLQGLLQNSKSALADGFLRWRLETEWTQVVGKTIAEQTLPVAFEKGTLFIWVRHSTWMQQLWYFQDPIRDKVNEHLTRKQLGAASGAGAQGLAQDTNYTVARAALPMPSNWCRQVKFTLSRRAATTEPEGSRD